MRKLSIFIATSLDGNVANLNERPVFLKLVEKKERLWLSKFTDTIHTLAGGL